MGFSRDQRVARGDPNGLDLTPEEYFVLSRIDGDATVGEVLAGSGLGRADTERILNRLCEVGAVVVSGRQPTPPPSAAPMKPPSPGSFRDRAQTRKRRVLQSQLRVNGASPSTATPGSAVAASASARVELNDEPPASESEDVEELFEPPRLEGDDPRLDANSPIPLEQQRWILALADGQETLNPFDFLGLFPTDDVRAIKRAFHDTSRRLHPDSYYGKDLGAYREILSSLFHRAKFYYAELRKPDVRGPYVQQRTSDLERKRRTVAMAVEQELAADELKRAADEAEAALRRRERAAARKDRERQRVWSKVKAEVSLRIAEASDAQAQGKLARAANLYRLALQLDPKNRELRRTWEECRDEARRTRAAEAFSQAQRLIEFGHTKEALPLLIDAARAHGKVEHLAVAAEAVRETDVSEARNFAMAALDALVKEKDTERTPPEIASIRVMLGRAFLAAGQTETAKQQALAAKELRPDDPEVRALLKSLKVK